MASLVDTTTASENTHNEQGRRQGRTKYGQYHPTADVTASTSGCLCLSAVGGVPSGRHGREDLVDW
jgi:hypothetical protein